MHHLFCTTIYSFQTCIIKEQNFAVGKIPLLKSPVNPSDWEKDCLHIQGGKRSFKAFFAHREKRISSLVCQRIWETITVQLSPECLIKDGKDGERQDGERDHGKDGLHLKCHGQVVKTFESALNLQASGSPGFIYWYKSMKNKQHEIYKQSDNTFCFWTGANSTNWSLGFSFITWVWKTFLSQ